MGDSTIFFAVFLKAGQITPFKTKKTISLASDSTLSEFVARVNATIREEASNLGGVSFVFDSKCKVGQNGSLKGISSTENVPLVMYDCTLYPPKNITEMVESYSSTIGPKSITLQKLGWFPSANIVICQSDDVESISANTTSNVHTSDEFEYNNPQNIDTNDGTKVNIKQVQLRGELGAAVRNLSSPNTKTKPPPSKIFKAVEERFETNSENDHVIQDPIAAQMEVKKQKRQKEEERRKLLDMRIAQLDQLNNKSSKKGKARGKTTNVSEQVKKMLIKSRATGNKKLRQEDRFYLETVLLDETKMNDTNTNMSGSLSLLVDESQNVNQFMSSSYTFYSRVATVGKIISDATVGSAANARDVGAELLILTSFEDNEDDKDDERVLVYRRLPPTLPLHEAEAKGFVTSFGQVLVRIFKGGKDSVSSYYTQSVAL